MEQPDMDGEYEEVAESELPRRATLIPSNAVFKLNTDDYSKIKLKVLTVVPGNRDAELELVRSDRAAADMLIIQMIIRLEEILGLNMTTAETKGEYMYSGTIKRDVYVRPQVLSQEARKDV